MPLLAQPGLDWSVTVDKLPGAFDYYILTMSEGGDEGSREALSRYMVWPVPDIVLFDENLLHRWGIGEGPSLEWSKETVSEDEETFILSLDCFTSEESGEEDDSILL